MWLFKTRVVVIRKAGGTTEFSGIQSAWLTLLSNKMRTETCYFDAKKRAWSDFEFACDRIF